MNKVFMGYTMTQASAYYRMIGFAETMKKLKLFDYLTITDGAGSDLHGLERAIADKDTQLDVENEFTFLAKKKKVAPYIFQLFSTEAGLALMDLLHHYQQPVITDLDDWALGVDATNPAYDLLKPGSKAYKITLAQIEASDALIVSTHKLKELLKTYHTNIHVVPNGLDLKRWSKFKNNTHKTYTHIGWEGGDGHLNDLEIIVPAIKHIHDKYKKVKFTFLGGNIPKEIRDLERVKHIRKWISVEDYPREKAKLGFDIELAPLADSHFNRAKSNIRWLEASALKIPIIASNTGPYKCIKNGKDGYLVRTTEEWIEKLELLVKDKEQRAKIGKAGYTRVNREFSLKASSEKYAKVIEEEMKEHNRRVRSVNKSK